eukprot:1862048-Pyramimonas_sp.AAC.1
MLRFPTLHWPRNELLHASSHLINSVNCQKDRTLSTPSCQNSPNARCAHPAGTSRGLDARK